MAQRHRPAAHRTRPASPRAPRRTSRPLAVGAAIVSFALTAALAIAPQAPSSTADPLSADAAGPSQTLTVSNSVAVADVTRARYAAAPGRQSLVSGGTNYDWAKLVLLSGGWPQSDANVTVLVRWMRQENGTDSWWNRDNPLNNGLGSGGGGGTGSYPNLVLAAQKVAENLQRNGGFVSIAAAFAASAPTSVTEQAIWASPWASSHYGNGSRWHTTPVPVVSAPASAW
jgi:hypothetical protein